MASRSYLVVEDAELVARSYRRALTAERHRCRIADDAGEGLRALDEDGFDHIISDIRLPSEEGAPATDDLGITIARRATSIGTPVTLLTGHDASHAAAILAHFGRASLADRHARRPRAMPRAVTRWKAIPVVGAGDIEGTLAYVRDRLGFRVVDEHRPSSDGLVYAILCRGDASLHLQIRRGGQRSVPREAHETDVYFEVDDVDALHAEFVGNGVVMHRDIQDEPYGMRDFTIELPDGVRLAFAEPLGA